ncbi:hypothetical protein WOC76_00860 [Methylocystis sp. IM3]|uniref:hypothetical protein n=1 Tax=unclassified Methylocystis TaxID=2625913 RepID=UPI0030F5827F
MNVQVFKFPIRVARRGAVWCEPLKIHFPQVHRLVRKKASMSSAAPGLRHNETLVVCDFSLFNLGGDLTGSIPLRHLSPSEDRSLIVRHHWSKLLANAYLQGGEDMDPDQPCGGLYETEQAIFTIAKCRTRKSWPGPMIFYLADVFEDDSEIGVQIWEKSIGVDGELRTTDIFYNDG